MTIRSVFVFILAGFILVSCNQNSKNKGFARSESQGSTVHVASGDLGALFEKVEPNKLEEIQSEVLDSSLNDLLTGKFGDPLTHTDIEIVEIDGFVFENVGSTLQETMDKYDFDAPVFHQPLREILDAGGITMDDILTPDGFAPDKLAQVHQLYENVLRYGSEASPELDEAGDNIDTFSLSLQAGMGEPKKGCKDSVKAGVAGGVGIAGIGAIGMAGCSVIAGVTAGAGLPLCVGLTLGGMSASGATAAGGIVGASVQCDWSEGFKKGLDGTLD